MYIGTNFNRYNETAEYMYIQMHFRFDFITEANTRNSDQTVSFGAEWSGSIVFTIWAT